MAEFEDVKTHVQELRRLHGMRDQICRRMDKLYWMEWDEETAVVSQLENPKITRSPRGRNAIEGIVRLLCASDPIFEIPSDINNASVKRVEGSLEKFAKALWFGASRVNGAPLHYDLVRSAALYGESCVEITSTRDLYEYSKGTVNEDRAKDLMRRIPYVYDVLNPQECYPEYDKIGMVGWHHRTKQTIASLKRNFGELALKPIIGMKHNSLTDYSEVNLNDWYDLEKRWVWIDESEEPILAGEAHGLPFIPIVHTIMEGSKLFADEEKRREPILYALDRSGLLDRQNMILTVMYSMLFAIGTNPMFVEYLINPDNPPEVDYSQAGGTIRYRVGERRDVMSKQVIDPAMTQAWQIAEQLEMESTIYRQTLGEPLGANSPYSMVALLSQAGRLPLLIPQRMASFAIGSIIEYSLKWMRKEKWGNVAVRSAGSDILLSSDDIPEQFEVIAKLDIALPQDRLQAANAAQLLGQGDNPLVSKEWILREILNVQQAGDMTDQIWDEQVENIFMQRFVYEQMAQIAQLKQAAMQPPGMNASGMPGTQEMPQSGAPAPGEQQGTPQFIPESVLNQRVQPMKPLPPFPPIAGPAVGQQGGTPEPEVME